jgi:hypothetical protein
MGEKRIISTEIEYSELSESEKFTAEEQIDQCCEEVSVDECADVGKVSPYVSADQEDWDFDPDEITAQYKKTYGEKFLGVELIAVGPEGNCGEKHETWEGRLDCCDEVDEIVFDWDSSVEVLEPGSSGIVSFTGGRLPALVKIRGNGFSLDGYSLRDAWTYSRSFRVYAHEIACGFAPITIDDGCTVAQGGVRSSLGEWVLIAGGSISDYQIPVSECPISMSNDDHSYNDFEGHVWDRTEGKYKLKQGSDPNQCDYSCVSPTNHACGLSKCQTTPSGARRHSVVPDFMDALDKPAGAVGDWVYESDDACIWISTTDCVHTYTADHRRSLWEWRC